MSRWLIDRGGALFLIVVVVYLWLAPTTVVDGDNAEFSALGAIGGRAHPSGYPAYVLYLRIVSWLPGATPAHSAALATGILGACAVLVLHAACRAWGARPLAATIAASIYAAGPIVLRTHTQAEVFAMNALAVAIVLWLAAANGPARGSGRVALLGVVAGLGLANHLTCVLVAPIGLLGAIRGIRESRRRALAVTAGVGALSLGLAPYVYLLVADGPISWGYVGDFGDVWAFFTRESYGGIGSFLPNGEVPLAGQLALFAESHLRAWLAVPAALAIATLAFRCVRGGDGEPVWGWRTLAISWLISGPILVAQFNIPLDGFGPYVCRRFHLLPLLLLAIPVAVGLDRAGDWLATRARLHRVQAAGPALACLGFVALVVVALPRLRAQHSPAMERSAEYLLRSLPDRSIVVAMADDLCFASDYLQHVRGVRPDITVVCWVLTSHVWFAPRLAAKGLLLQPFTPSISRRQAQLWMATGRPLFVEQGTDGMLADLPRYPFGVVMRVLSHDSAPPTALDVLRDNRALFDGFELDYPHPGRDDDWATIVHVRYARAWRDIARLLAKAGADDEARIAVDIAHAYYPRE